MAKKDKRPEFITPPSRAKWPKLNEPDYGTDDYPDEAGSFKVSLVMDQKTSEKFLKKMQPAMDEAVSEAKKRFAKLKPALKKKLGDITINEPGIPIFDDDENETGEMEFRFKMKASGKNKKTGKKWTRVCPVFDTQRKAINLKKVDINGGSTLKVAFVAVPYFVEATGVCGITFYMNAVQVIDLSTFERDAASFGFGEEDGYTYEEAEDDGTFSDDDDADVEESDDAEDDDF